MDDPRYIPVECKRPGSMRCPPVPCEGCPYANAADLRPAPMEAK